MMPLQTAKITQGIVQRDSRGYVRFDRSILIDEGLLKEIVEQVYLKQHVDLKIKTLSEPFKDYDASGAIKTGREGMKKWTIDERRQVLMNPDLGDHTLGKQMGRSGMSIMMRRASLVTEFDAWRVAKEGADKMSRQEQVDTYLKENFRE